MNQLQKKPFTLPRWQELPGIGLYSDQVVTLITQTLQPILGARPESGKKRDTGILTGTMLNNYVKMRIISPPEKKQYSREQVATLIVLCILKQVYSIQDISALISVALNSTVLSAAYNRFCVLFEDVLCSTTQKTDFLRTDPENENLYLLKSVLISCCTKFYVQRVLRSGGQSR